MPASNQPVETSSTRRPLERSTVGPQLAEATSAMTSRGAGARIAGYCKTSAPAAGTNLELANVHLLQRFVSRRAIRAERRQIAAADADDDRPRVIVGRRDERTVVRPTR